MKPLEWFSRQPPRRRAALSVVAVLLGLWMVDRLFFRPVFRLPLSALTRDIAQTEANLLEAIRLNRQDETVRAAFVAYEPFVQASTASPDRRAQLHKELEQAVLHSGLVLIDLKSSAKEDYTILLEGEGTIAQLVEFLDAIQRSPSLLKVLRMTLRASESLGFARDEQAQDALRGSFVISTLVLPEEPLVR